MDLYAKYIKERLDQDIVEIPEGFITYQIFKNHKQLYIADIYILPEYRRKHIGTKLFNKAVEIAKDNNCAYLGCITDATTNGWEAVREGLLKQGFIESEMNSDGIIHYYRDI